MSVWTVVSSTQKTNKSCQLCDKNVSSSRSPYCLDHLCPECFGTKKDNFKICFNCHRTKQFESKDLIESSDGGKSEQCGAHTCTIFTYNKYCPLHLCECGQRKSRVAYRCAQCANIKIEDWPFLSQTPTVVEKLFYDYSMVRALLIHASGQEWTDNYTKPLNKAFLVRLALVIRFMEMIRFKGMPRVTDDDIKEEKALQFQGLIGPLKIRLNNMKTGLENVLKHFEAPRSQEFSEVIGALDKNLADLASYVVRK